MFTHPYFERLRREDPVHYRNDGMYGSFWSVTKFKDIMAVETHPEIYSSEAKLGGITITDRPMEFRRSSFISMDPPRHDDQRKVVSPIVAPANLNNMSDIIRQRVCKVLDNLPRNETFDWVKLVSIELTTLMLTTLFDFPEDERHKLTYWSDIATHGRQRRRHHRLRGKAAGNPEGSGAPCSPPCGTSAPRGRRAST